MSKRLLSKQAFSLEDFKNATRIEKMYIYMMYPEKFVLHESQYRWFLKVQKAFALCSQEVSRTAAIRKIQNNIVGLEDYKAANKAYNDMQELYGNFIQQNKEFRRQLYIERHLALAKKAKKEGDLTEQRLNIEAAAKLEQFDKQEALNPADLKIPEVTFSTDINVLKAASQEAEDMDYEEND